MGLQKEVSIVQDSKIEIKKKIDKTLNLKEINMI